MKNNGNRGFAIALAWPETLCKQAGAWYDTPMQLLGLCQNNYYKVGHSAVVLVDPESGSCHYFDFGRYHAPYGYGRVRDHETDHELKICTKASIENNCRIENMEAIMTELLKNTSCHGTGKLLASYCQIDFNKALAKAKRWQEKSPWKYGPFIWNGTNCSRFVRTIILAGQPEWKYRIGLGLPATVSPTPLWNVRSLDYTFMKTHENERDIASTRPSLLYTELRSMAGR